MWISVYFGTLGMNSLLKLISAIGHKFRVLKIIKLVYNILMFLFLFSWLVWGNMLYYSEENDCKEIDETYRYNRMMLLLIIAGYIQMLVITVLICIGGICLYLIYA